MSYIAENMKVVDDRVVFKVDVVGGGLPGPRGPKGEDAFITPNMFAGQGMTDQQKVQEALLWAIQKKKSLYIPWNEERDSDIWLLDEAVLLQSNSIIYIDNARLKLSDIARDNIFRSANCGIGIENPFENPLHNISIIGIGNAVIEGADNPRSTGDSGKSLTIDTIAGNFSYGTDSLNPSAKQTGDWRNNGIIIAYTTGIKIQGIKCSNLHAYAISCERSKSGIIRDIVLDGEEHRIYNGAERIARNNDGINLRQSASDFLIENISGFSGDDPIALSVFKVPSGYPAGTLDTTSATGNLFYETDYIHNVQIQGVRCGTYANIVRLLNTNGSKMFDINVRDISDTSGDYELKRAPTGAAVLLGDNNPVYGGPTALGDCKNITIDNVKSINNRFGIRVMGSIADSSITNIRKYSSEFHSIHYPPIYFAPASAGASNLYRANIYNDDIPVSSPSDTGSWMNNDQNGRLQVVNGPINMADNYSPLLTDLSLVNKKFVMDIVPAILYSITQAPAIVDAIISRATIEGFAIPSLSVQKYMAELIGEMMATGSWEKQDLFLQAAYEDLELGNFSRINWKNPSGGLAVVEEGISIEPSGWKGNGISGYISTGFNFVIGENNYKQDDAGRGVVVYEREGNSVIDGVSGSNINSILLQNNNGQRINSGSNTLDESVDLDGTGYKGINRDDSQIVRLYNKGQESIRTQTSTPLSSHIQTILRRYNSYGSSTVSMYHMGASLTKDETQGLRAAYNNFLVKLGLNPIA